MNTPLFVLMTLDADRRRDHEVAMAKFDKAMMNLLTQQPCLESILWERRATMLEMIDKEMKEIAKAISEVPVKGIS